MTGQTVIEVGDLSVGYARNDGTVREVVSDVAMHLDRSEILGLAGESGCGKSTTALAMVGYRAMGARILSGRSVIDGIDVLTRSTRELRRIWGRKVAYVGQNAGLALNPAMTVERQLAQPLSVHLKLHGAVLRARQLELLEGMGLPDPAAALSRYPFQFSGGQQQRIALAIALSAKPEVLILDEPTTGLDVTLQARIAKLLRKLVADSGIACLYVSHDLALLGSLADRLAVMYAGELVEEGPASAVLREARHPYSRALLAAAPNLQDPRYVAGIPGSPPTEVVRDACAYAPRCPHVASQCTAGRISMQEIASGHNVRCARAKEIQHARVPRRELPVALVGREPLLAIEEVWCEYRGAVEPAVKAVSLVAYPADRIGIVGESGSGKSTLLRAIAGLHKPAAGFITFRGIALPATAVKRPRPTLKAIQLVFQNPDSSLNPQKTALALVARPIRLFRTDVPRNRERDVVLELFDLLKLPDALLHRYPRELSGGQRQRIALARAFAAQPAILLCDEVTSALDVSVQATIIELITELSVRSGTTVIWVSHDLSVVRTIANRVLVMRNGSVCEEAKSDEVFTNPRHPYTRELLAAIPRLGVG